MATGGRVQALGGLLLLAGLLLVTGSWWPLVAAGALLLVGPEVPGLVVVARRWHAARVKRARTRATLGRWAAGEVDRRSAA